MESKKYFFQSTIREALSTGNLMDETDISTRHKNSISLLNTELVKIILSLLYGTIHLQLPVCLLSFLIFFYFDHCTVSNILNPWESQRLW